MARRCFCIAIFALAALAFSTREASAQFGYGINLGDKVSPYLNLLAGGGAATGLPNYQNLVQPLVGGREAILSNQAGINQLQNQINGNGNGIGGSGGGGAARFFMQNNHFMNYSHYYQGLRH